MASVLLCAGLFATGLAGALAFSGVAHLWTAIRAAGAILFLVTMLAAARLAARRARSIALARERRRRRHAALIRVRRWLSEVDTAPRAPKTARQERQEMRRLENSAPERAVRFGWLLFTTNERDRLLLALTSGGRILFVRALLRDPATIATSSLASAAVTAFVLSEDEPAFDALGPDGIPFEVDDVADLLWLVENLNAAQPEASGRILLCGGGSPGVELDGTVLRVGRKIFDLASPLEWRPILFQEGLGTTAPLTAIARDDDVVPGGVIVYQGTKIRQLGVEAVVVSTLPSLPLGQPRPHRPAFLHPDLDRATCRDARLSQATADDPPPAELRTPVERVFMLPLRAALDRAPRASRSDVSSPAPAAAAS